MKLNFNLFFLFILFSLFLIPPANATLATSASAAISTGIENFFISTSDKIFDISISGYETPANNKTGPVACIYNIASWTPNPEKFLITNKFRDWSEMIFQEGYKLVLLCAFVIILFTHFKTDIAEKIEAITGFKIGSKSNILFRKALDGILIAVFMYIGIYFTLVLNDLLTKSVMLETLDSITPTPKNHVLYLLMAIAYLVLSIFFGARILIIFLFYSFAFVIGLCLLIDPLKKAAMNTCAYFVQVTFFQFIIVLYFSASILIIKSLNFPAISNEGTMYIVMLLGGFVLAIKLMLGTGVIKWVGKTIAVVL